MQHRIESEEQYRQMYQKSMQDIEGYWSEIARTFIWKKPWDNVLTGGFEHLDMKWFDGAELNITENCLDRHLDSKGDQLAIIWEPNDPSNAPLKITYKELHRRVCKFANVLKDQGVQKGDRVIFYMSMVPELLTGVLACARIGAVHSVVFGGFSANALAGRINDCKAKIVITNDEAYRGDKTVPLKNITDEALQSCASVNKVLCLKHTGGNINMQNGRDLWLNDLLDSASTECEATAVKAEDPLFILYTSGSTGQPKGLQHTTAGYMVWTSETFKNVFQYNDGDIYWCTADIGWITGHSYIAYGPLLNGATQVMFEGIPTWPDAGRFWEVVDKYKVTHFYTAPTAIRALEACDPKFVERADLGSLKVLGTVGEPINEEAWSWYSEKIGKNTCPIVDTWWQTETGGIMISTLANITESIPTFATNPLPGVDPILVDNEGNILSDNPVEGNLCIRRPWPGMARTIYGDHERFRQTYFSTYKGYYFTGDGAKRDEEGRYRIIGRVDDVINVSGHRIGTAEVEDAIDEHDDVVEAAVVGFPHDIKGQGILAYVTLFERKAPDHDTLLQELNELLIRMIGPIAKLDKLVVVPGLPKTRSGKIMRRILRKIAEGQSDQLGDISTLLNPEVVETIKQRFREVK